MDKIINFLTQPIAIPLWNHLLNITCLCLILWRNWYSRRNQKTLNKIVIKVNTKYKLDED